MIAPASMPAKGCAYLFQNGETEILASDPTELSGIYDVNESIRHAGYFLVRRIGASESQAEDGYGYARVFERLSPSLAWLVELSPLGDLSQLIFCDTALDMLSLVARIEHDLAAQTGKAVRR